MIAIIGLLVALLIPAVAGAVRRAREAAIQVEFTNISAALTAFKDKYGAYPPSRIVVSETGDYSAAHFTATLSPALAKQAIALTPRSVTALRQMFPKMVISASGPIGVTPPGGFYDFDGNGSLSTTPVILQGDECLLLFLGGLAKPVVGSGGLVVNGFSKNPLNPFQAEPTGPTAKAIPPRTEPFYGFDATRILDLNGNGFPSYVDSIGGISDPQPIVYFSSYGGVGYDPDDVNFAESADDSGTVYGNVFQSGNAATGTGTGLVAAHPDWIGSAGPNPYTTGLSVPPGGAAVYQMPQTFQLICAGRDRFFGVGGQYDPTNSPPLPFDAAAFLAITGLTETVAVRHADADNLTNFAASKLGQ